MQNASDANDVAERGEDVWLSWRPDHSLALVTNPADRLPEIDEEAS